MAQGYHTHIPHLIAAVTRTEGPVLEMGTGFYSTPILRDLCRTMGRELHSFESDPGWASRVASQLSPAETHHTYTVVSDYGQIATLNRPWGLAFLDHLPGERRLKDLQRLKECAAVIVVHGADGKALLNEIRSFKHWRFLSHLRPWKTAICSQTVDVTKWELVESSTPIPDPQPESFGTEEDQVRIPGVNYKGMDEVSQAKLKQLALTGFADINDAAEVRRPHLIAPGRPSGLNLYTRAGHSISLENHYYGATAFLVLSGPSARALPLDQLHGRGCCVMCVNNSWSLVRPHIWTAVDDPCTFLDKGWKDPGILKLVPYGKVDARLGTKHPTKGWRWSGRTVGQMPNVYFYKRNESFDPRTFLYEPTVNWGNHQKYTDILGCSGSRSVMLAAVRLLFYLGFRTINLVGCDFYMDNEHHYAFQQHREKGSIKGNMHTYRDLDIRFKALRPLMEAEGLKIYNTNPQSRLTAFEHKTYDVAVEEATGKFRGNLAEETDNAYTWHKSTGKKLPPGVNPR